MSPADRHTGPESNDRAHPNTNAEPEASPHADTRPDPNEARHADSDPDEPPHPDSDPDEPPHPDAGTKLEANDATHRPTAPGSPARTEPIRPRFGTLSLVLAMLVGALLGYAGGWLAPRLTEPGEESVEAGFARDMIFHHAQAVEMGLIGFQRASDPDVRQIAVDIATTQQGEIGMMHAWLTDWNLDPTGSSPTMAWMPAHTQHLSHDGLMPGMAQPEEMTALRGAAGRRLDIQFLQLMIRHHQGGVHMIDAALDGATEREVLDAARTMKSVQGTELANLTRLLTHLGGTPLPNE